MSKCMGTSCGAEKSNGYTHSTECLAEYDRVTDIRTISVSVSELEYWWQSLEGHPLDINTEYLIATMRGYLDTYYKYAAHE